MDYYLYIIILIGLTIFIIFYGGHNQQNKVEYNTKYFNNLNSIILFEKKINNILKNIIFDDNNKNFININKYIDTCEILIPNFINCFYIKINQYDYFNIFNIIDKKNFNTNMMIIYNLNKPNNIELLIDSSDNKLYDYNYNKNYLSNTNIHSNLIGYFYSLNKQISIVGPFHIFNNSNENIKIICFIIKKPFWYS